MSSITIFTSFEEKRQTFEGLESIAAWNTYGLSFAECVRLATESSDPNVLDTLTRSKWLTVRRCVASNPATHDGILKRQALELEKWVCFEILSHPQASLATKAMARIGYSVVQKNA